MHVLLLLQLEQLLLLLGLAAARLLLLEAPQRTPLGCGLQKARGQLLLAVAALLLHLFCHVTLSQRMTAVSVERPEQGGSAGQ